ncbi:hypothetical protein OXYTRIMIC_454 [Oxytricha trifallax]|uniref:Uncharacterized protein n=1 Tax=Oxytricha trifallax TaxID=1172189 RepID=A0A073I0P3_9SPIT|nr:hypothetical protein OXYTRIMIC_454 [Oxytricha trifallax]
MVILFELIEIQYINQLKKERSLTIKKAGKMQPKKQTLSGRRKLPVLTENNKQGKKALSQQTLEKYFENSKSSSQNSSFQNLNVQQEQNKWKNINKFSFKVENSRQLEFYQPVRVAEGWVRRNERFAEWQRTKRREQIINNKRRVNMKTIELRVCQQNVRGLNSKIKQDQLMKDIEAKILISQNQQKAVCKD